MKYPTVEKEKQKIQDKKQKDIIEAKLYDKADSIEEFYLNRVLEGIDHKCLFFDKFKCHYLMNNSWLRHLNVDKIGVISMIICVPTITASLYSFMPPKLGGCFRFSVIGLICAMIAFTLLAFGTIYAIMDDNTKKARHLIDELR